jgi:hypothetical protein
MKFSKGTFFNACIKKGTFLISFLAISISLGYSQSLPVGFETSISASDFMDFAGAQSAIIKNPHADTINPSAKVGRIIRNGGEVWAGSKLTLEENLDFSVQPIIPMKVWTNAPVGSIIKMKLEGFGETYRDIQTTVSGEWETLRWDFTGQPDNFNSLVLMFDFGNLGDGSKSSTFFFDDIEQVAGDIQIDLPVDFENPKVNYSMLDFGGNISFLASDPDGVENKVMQVVKHENALSWAGTTIGTPSGFARDIPLSLLDSKMTVSIWSPQANIPIRLKVESVNDPDRFCETESWTTVAGQWETLEFNFLNNVLKTVPLKTALEQGWRFKKASIFFNFGTDGKAAGEQTYFFDNVKFVPQNAIINDLENSLGDAHEKQIKRERSIFLGIISLLFVSFGTYLWFTKEKYKKEGERLNHELEKYSQDLSGQPIDSLEQRKEFVLDKEKIEKVIDAKIGETSWMILNLLFENPAISNKEIAKKVSLSLEGVSSSLRRMYTAFDLKPSGNKKVALVLKVMRILLKA